MMQSYASASEAPRRRAHSFPRHKSHGTNRDSATSNRHQRPVIWQTNLFRPKLSGVFSDRPSLRWAQNDAIWHHAFAHQSPQGNQKFACQGNDHGLAGTAGILGTGSKPLRQGTVLLEHEKSPRQLDHASADSNVARTRQSFLPASCTALVR
jgi:hypothetical protein